MEDLAKKSRDSILRPSHRESQRIPEETEAAAQTDQSKDEDDFPPVPAGFDDEQQLQRAISCLNKEILDWV